MDKLKNIWRSGRWILIILIGCVVVRGSLSYSGFCFDQRKYFSDQEKIDLAIQHVLKYYPPMTKFQEKQDDANRVDSLIRKPPSNTIYYESVDEFKFLNPDCCKVDIFGPEVPITSFLSKLHGEVSTIVEVKYKARFSDNNNKDFFERIKEIFMISNCGKVRSSL